MIGASKLTEQDVLDIKRLFRETTLNNAEISRMFGVSREMISCIRHGKRWNKMKHSFLMKEDVENAPHITTKIGQDEYITTISPIYISNKDKYIIIHILNKIEHSIEQTIYSEKPDYETILEKHKIFIGGFL